MPLWCQVRQKVLENLKKIVEAVGPDVVSGSVLPVVAALVTDPQWRVRERVLEQLPLLADHLGADVFEERLLSIYLSSYHDQVNAVRLAATRQLQPITNCLGVDWCVAKLVPKLREFYNSGANYQQRITILYAVQVWRGAPTCHVFFFFNDPARNVGLDTVFYHVALRFRAVH